jgi:hypothetical protein
MTESEPQIDQWMTLADLAEALSTDVMRAKQVISDREVLAERRGPERLLMVPAAFIADGAVVKHLPGTIRLLADAGFTDEQALRWLFTVQEDLQATPIDLLRSERSREVKRRAQASAW